MESSAEEPMKKTSSNFRNRPLKDLKTPSKRKNPKPGESQPTWQIERARAQGLAEHQTA